MKIDEIGNIYIKRMGKCPVFISTANEMNCLGNSYRGRSPTGVDGNFNNSNNNCSQKIIASQNNNQSSANNNHKASFKSLEQNKPEVIFNMKQFLLQLTDWFTKHHSTTPSNNYYNNKYPSVDFLEIFHQKCIHCIQLVICESESQRKVLRHPCWIALINIVGLDLLWSRFGSNNMILLNHHQLLNLRSGFAFMDAGGNCNHIHHHDNNKTTGK